MRIVHFIEVIDLAHGGPPVVAMRLANEQARQGHDVTLLTTYDSPAGAIDCNSVKCASLQARSTLRRFGLSAQGRLVEAIRGADVLHSHALWDPILPRTIDVCVQRGVSVCLTPNGQLTPYSLNQKSLKKRVALAVFWKRALRNLGFLHVLTEDERDDVRACGLTVPAAVIPNGVDTNEYCEGEHSAAVAALLPHSSTRRYILFLGRLVHQKGPDILCAAFNQIASLVPDVDLVFAGPDYGHESALRTQIARLGLSTRAHILGPVFGTAKLALLRGAACLCQPSRNEGFSMSVLEALACATPAVVSTECHFPDLANAGAGFVVAADVQPTATALLSLLQDEPARRRAAAAARQLIVTKYSVQAVANRLIEQYRALRGAVAAA